MYIYIYTCEFWRHENGSFLAPCWIPLDPLGSLLAPCWLPLAPFWLPVGSLWFPLVPLWLPVGSLRIPLAPFWILVGSLLAPFGYPLAPFWIPVGYLLAPFGVFLVPFGSLLAPFWFSFDSPRGSKSAQVDSICGGFALDFAKLPSRDFSTFCERGGANVGVRTFIYIKHCECTIVPTCTLPASIIYIYRER